MQVSEKPNMNMLCNFSSTYLWKKGGQGASVSQLSEEYIAFCMRVPFCRYTLTFATPYICHHKAFKVQEQPVSHIKCQAFTNAASDMRQDIMKDSAEHGVDHSCQRAADTGASTDGNSPKAGMDRDATEVLTEAEIPGEKVQKTDQAKSAEEGGTGEQQQVSHDRTGLGEGESVEGDGRRIGADVEL